MTCPSQWEPDLGFAIAEGRVKNISPESMRNVEAVVTCEAADGKFITSDTASAQFTPILPDRPLQVITPRNPLMSSASLALKRAFGGQIPAARAAP